MPSYKISEQNFQEIQKSIDGLLSSNLTPQQKNALMLIAGTLNRATPIETDADKEILTDQRAQQILGSNINGAIYFNYDTGKWNRNEYMGHPIKYEADNTKYAQEFKQRLESAPQFQDIDIIAYIIMPIYNTHFMDYDMTTTNPTYDSKGDFIVGNIICRNKKDGNILPINPKWTCHGRCGKPENVAKEVARFAIHMHWQKYFDAMINAHKKQR